MASTRRLLYQASTALIVLMFGLSGVMKLTPMFSPQVHGEMVRRSDVFARYLHTATGDCSALTPFQKSSFISFSRVPPIDVLKLDPDMYRLIVGVTELACVGIILLLEYRLRLMATYVLLVLMVGALYTQYMVGDLSYPEKFAGAVIGLILVLLRLYTMGELPSSITVKMD